jgi:hypothetical protein
MNPKTFISHAGEDKDRFVRDFASKLRNKGIDAWFAEWEIVPGDSIVQKVFDQGIKESNVFVVILSRFSVNKRWVREELDVGVIKKIEEGSRIIPVVIDDCEIPTALQATLWVRIHDLNSYEKELDQIVMSIYGQSARPPVGNPPTYASTTLDVIPGLTQIDSLILKVCVEIAIDEDQGKHVDVPDIIERAKQFDIPEGEALESFEVLTADGYLIEDHLVGDGRRFHHFEITTHGFDEYARVYIQNYQDLIMDVATQIVNHGAKNNKQLHSAVNAPRFVVDSTLDVMESMGWLRLSKAIGGWSHISQISPAMKRALREN